MASAKKTIKGGRVVSGMPEMTPQDLESQAAARMDKTKWLAEMAKKGGSAKALLMEAMIKDRPQIITDGTLAEEMASKSEGGPRKPKHYQADSGKSFSDRISGRRQSSNIEIRPIRTQGMWDDMMTDAIMEDMMKAKKD